MKMKSYSLNDKITSIHKEIDDREKENSEKKDRNEIRDIKKRKIIIKFAINEIRKVKDTKRYFTVILALTNRRCILAIAL